MARQHRMVVIKQLPVEGHPDGVMTVTEIQCSAGDHVAAILAATYAAGYRVAQHEHAVHSYAAGGDDLWGVVKKMREVRRGA